MGKRDRERDITPSSWPIPRRLDSDIPNNLLPKLFEQKVKCK